MRFFTFEIRLSYWHGFPVCRLIGLFGVKPFRTAEVVVKWWTSIGWLILIEWGKNPSVEMKQEPPLSRGLTRRRGVECFPPRRPCGLGRRLTSALEVEAVWRWVEGGEGLVLSIWLGRAGTAWRSPPRLHLQAAAESPICKRFPCIRRAFSGCSCFNSAASVLTRHELGWFSGFISQSPPKAETRIFFSPYTFFYPFIIFSFCGPLSFWLPPIPLFFLGGGRYYVIVRGIEHKSRGSSGPMNYWWESQHDPPRSAHFTSSSPRSRVNQPKWRKGEGGGVHCLDEDPAAAGEPAADPASFYWCFCSPAASVPLNTLYLCFCLFPILVF